MRKRDEAKGKLYQEQEINFSPLLAVISRLRVNGRKESRKEINLPPTICDHVVCGDCNVSDKSPADSYRFDFNPSRRSQDDVKAAICTQPIGGGEECA